jgi:hypothetical protein
MVAAVLISRSERPAPEAPLINSGHPFRRADCRGAGLTLRQTGSLVAAGALRQIVRGVLVDARRADEVGTRAAALQLARPGEAVIGRRTAAWLRGIEPSGLDGPRPMPVECVVASGCAPLRRPGVRCYSASLAGDVEEVEGVACTTSVRTALDLLRHLPPHLGLGYADAMAHAGLFPVTALVERAEGWRGGRNIARARRLAALCEPLTESFGESWTRLRILDAGFPRPTAQVPLGEGRVEFRLDLGYPERRIAIEYDGLEFHTERAHRRRDEVRRRKIRDVYGWTVVVVGRGDVLGRSVAFERAVGELLGLEPKVRARRW